MQSIRYFKLLIDEKYFVAHANQETVFLIAILQFDWIDEFNVYIETDGQRIPSKYQSTAFLPDDLPSDEKDAPKHLYSIFRCTYLYPHPSDTMEAHWKFRVGGKDFYTESIHFRVIDSA